MSPASLRPPTDRAALPLTGRSGFPHSEISVPSRLPPPGSAWHDQTRAQSPRVFLRVPDGARRFRLITQTADAPGPPPGGILIRHGAAFIAINDAGIQISNGQGATITLTGTAVDINQGAITALK